MSLAKALGAQRHRAGLSGWRAGFVLLGSMAVLGLAGCSDGTGFRPLYGSVGVGGEKVEDKLAAVEIAPIPGRVGQRVRNELIFQSTGGGAARTPEYRLNIVITESLTSTLVRLDGNATSQIYNVDAQYQLVRVSDKKVVATGRSSSRAAYERMTSVFANVRAREDAENRAARTLGEELRTRLLAALATTA